MDKQQFNRKILTAIICLLILIVSIFLVITGQKQIGTIGLLKMLIGIAGILALLGYYNSFYNK